MTITNHIEDTMQFTTKWRVNLESGHQKEYQTFIIWTFCRIIL